MWKSRPLYKRLLNLVSLLLVFRMTALVFAQEWEKAFGGPEYDFGYCIDQTDDGGFIVVGRTDSFVSSKNDPNDIYLIKTDSHGNKLWTRTFGGKAWDEARHVLITADGCYLILGYTYSFGAGSYDIYLIKTDGDGNELWSRTFGGESADYGIEVQQTVEGGYIIVGYSFSSKTNAFDFCLIKTDSRGNEIWTRTYGGDMGDRGFSVNETHDRGYIMVGHTCSFGMGSYDVYLIKTDVSGNVLWSKTFGGKEADYGVSVQQTTGGGYIILGHTFSFGSGNSDVYLIKTDACGNELWAKTFGGWDEDMGKCVKMTSGGGYIVLGQTASSGEGGYDVYLVKTDKDGNELWSTTFGGPRCDTGNYLTIARDGGYAIIGYTESIGAGLFDVYLLKIGKIIYDLQCKNSWACRPERYQKD